MRAHSMAAATGCNATRHSGAELLAVNVASRAGVRRKHHDALDNTMHAAAQAYEAPSGLRSTATVGNGPVNLGSPLQRA